MSALTDLFSAMANKIRSKTGTQTTYTPSEMVSDGIDDVYDAGYAAGGTSTSITPSNSSPAPMTSGTKYTPTTNGHAIRSYGSCYPGDDPWAVHNGDFYQITGEGYIINYVPPDPTRITPSNSSPVALTAYTAVEPRTSGYAIASYSSVTPSSTQVAVSSGDIVKIGGSGVIVDSVPTPTSITPSNSSPVALTANTPVNPTASGYAISSYSSKTPSDTSPASVSSGAIIKASSAGYLVKNTPVDLSTPDLVSNADMSASGTRTISVTQKPRYIVCVMTRYGSSQTDGRCYISLVDVARNTSRKVERGSSSYDSGTTQSGLTDNVTAVSASSVTIKNAVSVTVRSMVMIYY